MDITGKDFSYLRYMERWATYRAADGALSLAQVIKDDQGRNFSTLLSEMEMQVKSFNMNNIPQADALLVLGSPRALAYTAEIAIRYRNRYGKYPELFSAGDGRGMFAQRCSMNRWFQGKLADLGFPKKWAFHNVVAHSERNWDYVDEIKTLIERHMSAQNRYKVLVVTGVGCSLNLAMELYSAIPYADFFIFETPQTSKKMFDCEIFHPNSYGIDVLLVQVLKARMGTGKMRIPVEKLLEFPRLGFIRDMLLSGYAGCFSDPEMWKFIAIDAKTAQKLQRNRLAQLQKTVRPRRFAKQTQKLLDTIRKDLQRKGLRISQVF